MRNWTNIHQVKSTSRKESSLWIWGCNTNQQLQTWIKRDGLNQSDVMSENPRGSQKNTGPQLLMLKGM